MVPQVGQMKRGPCPWMASLTETTLSQSPHGPSHSLFKPRAPQSSPLPPHTQRPTVPPLPFHTQSPMVPPHPPHTQSPTVLVFRTWQPPPPPWAAWRLTHMSPPPPWPSQHLPHSSDCSKYPFVKNPGGRDGLFFYLLMSRVFLEIDK